MEAPLSILQKYWHHDSFRPMQEDIIKAALEEKDTLALLPTGGGKSVCFQIPGLMREGLCLVISPLIALMKDQVEQLRKRGIHAVAVHSGMRRDEIDILLNNAIYGDLKFLYVSPERLQTEIFIARFRQMKVGLIAVDEAHCISQWGYDFRPPYLKIASLRQIYPRVPIIALTASATAQVQDDITEKLQFRKDHAVFRKSFARPNLSFVVRKTENKDQKLLEILQKVNGAAIVYVRSRKATQEIARWLSKKNIKASFYHAGLVFEERAKRHDEWIQNHSRVMVATNAFGMGIDKADVRLVIHLDLPENLESYYQEAGRAGRDGNRAYAVILYQDADISNLELKVEQAQPPLAYLQVLYQSLANYYQLAVGSAEGESFEFDLHDFGERFRMNPVEVFNGLRKLEEEGLLQFNESFYSPSTLHFSVGHQKLYELQVANEGFDSLIKMLLRLYGGEIFSSFVRIDESLLAKGLKVSAQEVVDQLVHLNELRILLYTQKRDKPQVTYILSRQDAENLPLDHRRLEARRALVLDKVKAMTSFVESTFRCRMQLIQGYFDEHTEETCGICDVCIEKRRKDNTLAFEGLRSEVLTVMKKNIFTIEQLEKQIAPADRELFVDVVRELLDEGMLAYDNVWRLKLTT
ncbi:MAG: ATP-dependent DNA helicase RecQ [Cyclobacteriaceae bacterium]